MRRLGEIARAVGSLVVLAALVIGVPVGLVLGVGWPLPRSLPGGAELGEVLTQPADAISDEAILKALAVVVWIAWAQLAVCVLVELVAAARARRAARVPLAGPLQVLAARLVAPVVLMTSLAGARPAVAAAPLPSVQTMAAATAPVPPQAPVPASTTPEEPSAAPAEAAHKTYLVRPGDSLWDIAAAHLRDELGKPAPDRHMEIFGLNKGARQPDGRWLRRPNLIRPGWVLRLPADAVGLEGGLPAPAPAQLPGAAPPAPPPHPPAPPSSQAPAARPDAPPADAPATPRGTEGQPAPDLATPAPPQGGGAGPLPAPPAPARTAPSSNGAPATSTTEAPAPSAREGSPVAAGTQDEGVCLNGPGLLGAGLLAAGVVATLDRLRRIQQRRRRPGRRIPLPDAGAAGRERAARAGADPEAAVFLGLGLRAMAAGFEEADLEAPEVLGVELSPRQLEVLLAEPSTWAPPWFTAQAGGSRWVMDRYQVDAELEDFVLGVAAPLPALVTVGRKDDDALVLIDLEAGGCTCVVGDPDATREVVVAAAMELANKADDELFSLVLVGFGQELSDLERVQVVDSAGEVIDRLELEAAEKAQALEDSGWESPVVARVRGAPDSWGPTVVCCVEPPPPPLGDRLAALAGNAGVCVLVAGEIEAAPWQLVLGGDELDVVPLGVVVAPQRLADDEAADVGELLAMASSTDDEAPGEEPPEAEPTEDDALAQAWVEYEGSAEGGEAPERRQAGGEDGNAGRGREEEPPAPERPEVLVRVLGPVEIEGVAKPATRTKAIEAVAYLATHRDSRVDGLRLREALWPREAASKKSVEKLNSAMWDARKMLGSASDGSEHLPTLKGGQRDYPLNRTVGLDYDLFMAGVRRGRAQDQRPASIAVLKEALELVRGQPFEGTRRGYGWAHDHLSWEMTTQVSDAAHWLSQLCFEAGDHEGARWAAWQGLRASPWDRQLLKDLLVAEKALGGNARLKAVMEDLEVASEDQDEDGVDIEVVRAFEELLRQQEPERALRVAASG